MLSNLQRFFHTLETKFALEVGFDRICPIFADLQSDLDFQETFQGFYAFAVLLHVSLSPHQGKPFRTAQNLEKDVTNQRRNPEITLRVENHSISLKFFKYFSYTTCKPIAKTG